MFRCLAHLGVVVAGLAVVVCLGCAERAPKNARPSAKQGQPAAKEVKPEEKPKPEKPDTKDVKPAEQEPEEPAAAEAGPTSGRGGRAVGKVLKRLMQGTGGPGLRSGRSRPRRILPPAVDSDEAGKNAVTTYDLDGDRAISGQELDKAPALKAAVKNLDRNEDGKITAEEVTARIKAWQDSRVSLMSMACQVTLDGKPLEGATVTFVPERFLGTEIKPATGSTDDSGIANLSIPIAPGSDHPPGVACGLYRVHISRKAGDKELIPARYNVQTTLGKEAALDAEGMQEGILRFELTSR